MEPVGKPFRLEAKRYLRKYAPCDAASSHDRWRSYVPLDPLPVERGFRPSYAHCTRAAMPQLKAGDALWKHWHALAVG